VFGGEPPPPPAPAPTASFAFTNPTRLRRALRDNYTLLAGHVASDVQFEQSIFERNRRVSWASVAPLLLDLLIVLTALPLPTSTYALFALQC
jgi:hypothetical protein